MTEKVVEAVQLDRRRWIYRHDIVVRVTHWINAVCIVFLLLSGLQIFNAHPALYWGVKSDFDNPLLSMRAVEKGDDVAGVTRILGRDIDTTGWLGIATGPDGSLDERAFPSWATLPGSQDLATGRRWHFFFAWLFVINGLVYVVSGFASGHFRRDFIPTRAQWRQFGPTVVDHLRLRFPHGAEARQYNILQKLSYIGIIVLLPILILAGLAMSPAMDALIGLPSLFGGRQSARTVHFLAAAGILAFTLIHVVMVLVSGVGNNIRSMITGRYDIQHASKTRERKIED